MSSPPRYRCPRPMKSSELLVKFQRVRNDRAWILASHSPPAALAAGRGRFGVVRRYALDGLPLRQMRRDQRRACYKSNSSMRRSISSRSGSNPPSQDVAPMTEQQWVPIDDAAKDGRWQAVWSPRYDLLRARAVRANGKLSCWTTRNPRLRLTPEEVTHYWPGFRPPT